MKVPSTARMTGPSSNSRLSAPSLKRTRPSEPRIWLHHRYKPCRLNRLDVSVAVLDNDSYRLVFAIECAFLRVLRRFLVRTLLIVLAGAVLATAQQAADPNAEQKKIRIEGRVTSSTGQPVRKASVYLQSSTSARPNTPPATNYADQTGDDGTFVFENVAAGAYTLRAERTGYVTQRYGARTPSGEGTPLTVKEGDKLSKLDISLTQQAVILGRVTDTDGDGIPGAQVRVARFSYLNGVRQFRSEGTGGTTDDEGNFRVSGLSPGRYYVYADTLANSPQQMLNPPASGRSIAPPTALLSTYYPSSLDMRGATMIEAGPGSHVDANIRMRRERVYSIRGIVTNNGQPVARAMVAILAEEELPAAAPSSPAFSATLPFGGATQTDQEGRFELRNVLPGPHTLRAMVGGRLEVNSGTSSFMTSSFNAGGATNINGYLPVNVSSGDLNDVVFATGTTGEVTTRVRVEGGTLDDLRADIPKPQSPLAGNPLPALPTQLPSVRLAPNAATYVNGPSNSTNPDGTQRITNLTPGRYYLNPISVPQGYYIKSMRYGGADVTRTQLEYTGGTGEIEITVVKGTGEIGGSVVNGRGDPASGVTVSLWPRVPNRSTSSQGARTVIADQSGNFKFPNTAPEDYYLVAFEDLPEPGIAQYVGFLTLFTGEVASAKLEPNGTPTVTVKLIPREKAATEFTKLQ